MSPPLDLVSLPPDIMRHVVRVDPCSLDEMRLISPMWNAIVQEYANNCRYSQPLERLYLASGFQEPECYKLRIPPILTPWRWNNPFAIPLPKHLFLRNSAELHQVHMHAVIPGRYSARVGVGKWLDVQQQFTGAFEVTCTPQTITWSEKQLSGITWILALFLYGILLLSVLGNGPFLIQTAFFVACSFLLFLLASLFCDILRSTEFHGVMRRYLEKSDFAKRRARFTRFFTAFSHIETLVLDTFREYWNWNEAIATLEDIRIERIEFRSSVLCDVTKESLIEMTRKHHVRHISIVTIVIRLDTIGDFVAQLASMGATVNIYEVVEDKEFLESYPCVFFRPMEFWDAVKTKLEKDGVSLRVTAIWEHDFERKSCGSDVRACIFIKSSECKDYYCDVPVVRGHCQEVKYY